MDLFLRFSFSFILNHTPNKNTIWMTFEKKEVLIYVLGESQIIFLPKCWDSINFIWFNDLLHTQCFERIMELEPSIKCFQQYNKVFWNGEFNFISKLLDLFVCGSMRGSEWCSQTGWIGFKPINEIFDALLYLFDADSVCITDIWKLLLTKIYILPRGCELHSTWVFESIHELALENNYFRNFWITLVFNCLQQIN